MRQGRAHLGRGRRGRVIGTRSLAPPAPRATRARSPVRPFRRKGRTGDPGPSGRRGSGAPVPPKGGGKGGALGRRAVRQRHGGAVGHSAPTASRAAPRSKRVSSSRRSGLRKTRSSRAGEACRARERGGGHAVAALIRGVRGNAPGAAAQRRDLSGVPGQGDTLKAQAPIAWPVGQLLRSTGENPKPKPRGDPSIEFINII